MPKLERTAYKPNLTDPRVQKRLASVLAWCDLHLSSTSPEPIHHDAMRAVFGTATNPLTIWLRANLLTQHGAYVPGIKSYSYMLNEKGAAKLRALQHQHMVTTSVPDPVELYPELATLQFTYKLKSDRYWHRLQNIKRERKDDFWRPFLPFNYDIDAAAPTLLQQMAVQQGLHPLLGAGVEDYLANKDAYRQHIADLTGCSLIDAKRIINSLFNGALVGENRNWAIFRTLRADRAAMRRFVADPRIRALRTSIKQMWRAIGKRFDVSNSKAKWAVYFRVERRVLDVIRAELEKTGVKHFTEHDGFRAAQEVDLVSIQNAVRAQVGFDIKLTRTT